MKKQLKTYKFYFSQVNQEIYQQKGYSVEACLRRAIKEWRANNSNPVLLNVETLKSGMWKEFEHD